VSSNLLQIQVGKDDEEFAFRIIRKIIEENRKSAIEHPQDFLQMYLSKSEEERSEDGMTGT
jgi:hypothetical protein